MTAPSTRRHSCLTLTVELGEDEAIMHEFTGTKKFTVHPATKRAQARMKKKEKAMKRAVLQKQKADKAAAQKERERQKRLREAAAKNAESKGETGPQKSTEAAVSPTRAPRGFLPTSMTKVEAPLADLDGPMLGIERTAPVAREVRRYGQRSIFVRPQSSRGGAPPPAALNKSTS